MDVRIRSQLRLQVRPVGRVEGWRYRKEQRRHQRVAVFIEDPDRSDAGQRCDELFQPFAQLGFVQLDGPVGATARDLLDTVEGDADRLEDPQRLFRGDVERPLNALIGKLEGGVVRPPPDVAEQQHGQRHARDEHPFESSKRGVPALSHAESSRQPLKADGESNISYAPWRKDGRRRRKWPGRRQWARGPLVNRTLVVS